MSDPAVEQIGDRGQPDMRVRAHVDRLTGAQDRRSHAVEEDERPDQPALCGRQRAAHLESADILGVGYDHQFDLVAGEAVAGLGVTSGKEAHRFLLIFTLVGRWSR